MILSVQKKASRFSLKLFLYFYIIFFFSGCEVLSTTKQIETPLLDKNNYIQFVSLETEQTAQTIEKTQFEWQELYKGIEFCTFFDKSSSSVCNAVKIKLDTQNLKIIASNPVEPFYNNLTSIFKGETTRKFAKNNNAIVAVNATPFNYPAGRLSNKRTLAGIYAVNDIIYARKAGNYAALVFYQDKHGKFFAKVLDSQNDFEPNDSTRFAFGGFWALIKNNDIIKFDSKQKEPRSAAGIINNGRTLILLAIDKSNFTSKGATFNETSSILYNLGAEEAIMLDGGSSSSLVIDGKQISKAFPHVEVALSFGFVFDEPNDKPKTDESELKESKLDKSEIKP